MNERNYKGITLIALVVTIIILLILAGLSIQILSGENGLINRTISAKETTEKAEEKELVELAVSAAQIDGEGTITTDNLNNALKETFNNDTNASENSEGWTYQGNKKYKIYSNGKVEEMKEDQIILPDGYTECEYLESTGTQYIDTGYYSNSETRTILEFSYIMTNNDQYSNGAVFGSANNGNRKTWIFNYGYIG